MAEVNIGEVRMNTTVRDGDGGTTLDACTLAQIVEAVLREMERRSRADARSRNITRIGEDG